MKPSLLFIFPALLFAGHLSAQDTIVQTDGTQIIAHVIEVGTAEIKYKKYQNLQTSPVKVLLLIGGCLALAGIPLGALGLAILRFY